MRPRTSCSRDGDVVLWFYRQTDSALSDAARPAAYMSALVRIAPGGGAVHSGGMSASPGIVLKKPFSLMSEDFKDRWCVLVAAKRGTTSITAKTIADPDIDSTSPRSGKNRRSLHCEIFGAPRFSSFSTQSAGEFASKFFKTSEFQACCSCRT